MATEKITVEFTRPQLDSIIQAAALLDAGSFSDFYGGGLGGAREWNVFQRAFKKILRASQRPSKRFPSKPIAP